MITYSSAAAYLAHARRGDRIALVQSSGSATTQVLTKRDVLTVFDSGPKTVRCKAWRQHKAKCLRHKRHPLAVLTESEYQRLQE